MAERTPEMSVAEFETIASAAPETVTLEFLGGRIGVKRTPDGDRSTVVAWLARRCMQSRPELDLYQGTGLRVETYREGRAKRMRYSHPRPTSRGTANGPTRTGL